MATKTAVIIPCDEVVHIFAIPPLSPQPPDFHDRNPTHIPPHFTIPFPDGFVLHSVYRRFETISSWYFGSSQPLYFDMTWKDSKPHRFKIMLKPDLSTASLHVVNTGELTPLDFPFSSFWGGYKICEDTLVICWNAEGCHFNPPSRKTQCGVYTGSTSTRFTNVNSNGGSALNMLLPDIGDWWLGCEVCPASGRFVLQDIDGLIVLDVF